MSKRRRDERRSSEEEESPRKKRRDVDLKLVPVTFSESVGLFLNHDGEYADNKPETTGKFSIENISKKDRIWDIAIELDDTGSTDLDDTIEIREINPEDTEEIEYKVTQEPKNVLSVREFISALDEDTASYSLIMGRRNEIYVKLTIENESDEDLKNIEVHKFVPSEFEDVDITRKSEGSAEVDMIDGERAVKWVIDELPAGRDETLSLKFFITVEDIETKVRSGKIVTKYSAPYLMSGVKLNPEKWHSYTNNNMYLSADELDETPNRFECKFVFENTSEFVVKLLDIDVHDVDTPGKNFVKVDSDTKLSENAKWSSESWKFDVKEGTDPQFIKRVDFTTLAEVKTETLTTVDIEDFELAVAALEADLKYDATELASYRETVFNAIATVSNTGGADLNEVSYREIIQSNFKAPLAEDVVVKYNGTELDSSIYSVQISPDDEGSSREHEVLVELKELVDTSIESFKPGDSLDITYPITADRPAMDVEYQPDALVTGNTLPAGQPIEIILKPEGLVIPVIHVRKRFITGKDVEAMSQSGKYLVTLWIQNTGNFEMLNYELHDELKEGSTIISEVVQRLGEYQGVPEEIDLEEVVDQVAVADEEDVTEEISKKRRERIKGPQELVWTAEKIPPNERFIVKYVIKKDK
ncbi:MAG: hypothetical protein JW776_06165 [Candidatus Lokiarchaeota archaeon]|nr:hypothetical protein [Candidatus Lokiarchaeota archaeon]